MDKYKTALNILVGVVTCWAGWAAGFLTGRGLEVGATLTVFVVIGTGVAGIVFFVILIGDL